MKVLVGQPTFLPYPGFFDKLRRVDMWVILDTVQFNEREFQNRNRIRVKPPIGWKWLTIPIRERYQGKPIKDVSVSPFSGDRKEDWVPYHLAMFDVYYRKAPFFKELYPVLRDEYRSLNNLAGPSQTTTLPLTIFNLSFIERFKRMLGLKTKYVLASELNPPPELKASDLLLWLVQQVGGTTYLSGVMGKDYLEVSKFVDKGIAVEFQEYKANPYPQLNYPDFVEKLSIVDMIFNIGSVKTREVF